MTRDRERERSRDGGAQGGGAKGGGRRASVAGAVISTDPAFREALRASLAERGGGVAINLEIGVPFTEIADPQLDELRRLEPGIVFLDLENDPHVGLKFAGFLIDSSICQALIGAGASPSPDLLLSAMQAGISEFLSKPVTTDSVDEALERVWRKTGKKIEESRRAPGKLLPIFSAKGGAGSTTLGVNLAIEIHRLTRKKTLLVDLDLELGETALLLGMEPRFSIVDLVRNFHRVDSGLLASYIERHESGIELLSAPFQPADFEAVSAERVGQILEFLKQHYEYVIVDSPKTFNPATLAAFREADRLFLVTTADLPSLRNLSRCLPLLKSVRGHRAEEWLRLIVNRHEPGQVITLEEVERTLDLETYGSLRNDYEAVMTSINEGEPAVTRGKSNFAQDVRELASRITGVPLGEDAGPGLLGRLLSPFRNGRAGGGAGGSGPRKKRQSEKVTSDE